MGTTVFERERPAASAVRHSLEGSAHGAFWLDDLPDGPSRPALAGERTADLVVVGGGYTGLWTALLARRRDPDARIAIVEARTVGWAASGRNGGFCEATLTHGRENGASRWPDEIDRLDELGLENLDAFEADLAAWGVDADFERAGALTVAVEPHQLEWLREMAGGPDEVLLDRAQTQAAVASPTYLGGVWSRRTSATLHPGKLATGLAEAAERQGVEIFEHSLVRAVETHDRGVDVITDAGRIRASRAVLATNVFPALLRRNTLMTVPVYDYVLMTEPLTAAQWRTVGWTGGQGVSDMANQFHYYRRTRDGRILFGGYDAVYHYGGRVRASYENRPASWERLASHFLTTFPQLEGVRFTHRWAGAIDTCSRFCAFYGTARRGRIAYAAGFTGLGVGAARFAGEVMLDLLDGVDTERTRLQMVRERPLPFPPEPAAAIGVALSRWSMDRADHHEGRRNLVLKTLDALGLGFDS